MITLKPWRLARQTAAYVCRRIRGSAVGSALAEREARLERAMSWLCRAHDQCGGKGVSEGYHLYHGWLPPYPETTGYIIETFWDYFHRTGDRSMRDRALRMAQWLLDIQHEDGSFPDSYFKQRLVFDTGQILFGLVRTFEETKDERFLVSARRAGDWLVEVQDHDGAWRKHALHGIHHAYYSRVGWSLVRLHRVSGADRYREAAVRNARWTIQQQRLNGWFDHAAFTVEQHSRPLTHTIAYTIRGLLEIGLALDESTFVQAAERGVAGLRLVLPKDSFPAGRYDRNWHGDASFSCLTGNVQLAIILFRLAAARKSLELFNHGVAINDMMEEEQALTAASDDVRGAVAGSRPLWGPYIRFAYPNWATKFMAESLLLESRTGDELARSHVEGEGRL